MDHLQRKRLRFRAGRSLMGSYLKSLGRREIDNRSLRVSPLQLMSAVADRIKVVPRKLTLSSF